MMVEGCGLGLRDDFIDEIPSYAKRIDFLEVVPENMMHLNRKEAKRFERICEAFPVVAHGLSLSLGDVGSLDLIHLGRLKKFLERYGIEHYSEHLSFTSLDGVQSYELLPLPMTETMADAVTEKIARIEEILERPLIIENPTYYTVLESTMDETAFIGAILERSGAKLLLDINNVFVNGFNHRFDAKAFIDAIDLERVAYCHIAGHLEYRDDLFIDTHGMPVKEEVWDLMAYVMAKKRLPVMLERDNNVPPLETLMKEFERMREIHHAA
ncbi:DUF692 domain-containing protein [Hydrogenimonas cancrithermarum]|uniref:UPF0276 protein n=1 Tax=Hydrogenimonas cancrithermarum TaxID=2993563 RepID=A0ABM8FM27_9BACT|nr:DUF692 domain-containing protein [Hydrogenimonas cancrithermarum]BDY12450.1 UPF0276 protein [Hydrogenimonas cancrithermarum]